MLSFVTRVEQAGLTFDIWYNDEEKVFETTYHNHVYQDTDQEELIMEIIACEGSELARETPWN